jgi:hypothetical protein
VKRSIQLEANAGSAGVPRGHLSSNADFTAETRVRFPQAAAEVANAQWYLLPFAGVPATYPAAAASEDAKKAR